ncbi:ABC transporter permease [Sphingomonas sp. CL5.1]|uniref:ABC transporter permease n=1 Tax=Sphingomonas sp. CL5.1 TaxID=2653203 RepID=UPI00158285A0|nr:ABC transporter permease [Sphingomonas sp. CL5.1]QKS01365.1 ABC transporter permease [Sphingomonas sp. CL5.1]
MASAFASALRREVRFLAAHFWDLALVTWVPLLLMAVVSVQLSSGVMRDLPIAVVDQDGTAVSRELTRRLDAAPGLRVAARPTDMRAAEALVRSNRAYAVVLIPADTERAVLRGETGSITTFYNASYSTPSGAALREVGNVVQGYAATLAVEQTAAVAGPGRVRHPPVAAQSAMLFNPQGSYELQLVTLIHPALLHLIFMVAVVSALGRELRDGTIGAWIGADPPARAVAAVAGKLAPYLAIFIGWGLLAIGYVAGLRGWPVAGSVAMLLAGYAAMYLAYVGVSLLVIGLSLSMGKALSAVGLYAGASFAFAGAIFPVESASAFARLWSALLPYSAFAKLLAEQWIMGAPASQSMWQVLAMLAFLLVSGAIGLPRYLAAARRPDTWGRR